MILNYFLLKETKVLGDIIDSRLRAEETLEQQAAIYVHVKDSETKLHKHSLGQDGMVIINKNNNYSGLKCIKNV